MKRLKMDKGILKFSIIQCWLALIPFDIAEAAEAGLDNQSFEGRTFGTVLRSQRSHMRALFPNPKAFCEPPPKFHFQAGSQRLCEGWND